jgi:hypothetical protein
MLALMRSAVAVWIVCMVVASLVVSEVIVLFARAALRSTTKKRLCP